MVMEEKRKEIMAITQSKDRQIKDLNNYSNDQRNSFQQKVSQLEKQLSQNYEDLSKLKGDYANVQIQLQDATTQIKIYQENIDSLESNHQHELKSIAEVLSYLVAIPPEPRQPAGLHQAELPEAARLAARRGREAQGHPQRQVRRVRAEQAGSRRALRVPGEC